MRTAIHSLVVLLTISASLRVAQSQAAWSTNQLTTSALVERQQRALFSQPLSSFVLPVATGLPSSNIVDNAAGRQLQADKSAFPFLATLPGPGVAAFITALKPCGMINVHSHPRATELYVIISGQMTGGIAQEAGSPQNVTFTVNPGQTMVVPQGLWHFNLNAGCTPNVFIQVFSSADPGTVPLTGALAGLTSASAEAAAAGNFTTSPGSLGALALSQACLQRCNLPATGASGNGFSGLSPELQAFLGVGGASPAGAPPVRAPASG